MTSKDLTKELYFGKNDATSVEEVMALFQHMFQLDWTIDIYKNKEPQTFNLSKLGWKVGVNKAKTSAGYCQWRWEIVNEFFGEKRYYGKKVELSLHYLGQEQNLAEGKGLEWEEVIRHELAHAIDFEMRKKSNHDKHWKAVANAMLSNGRRTFTKKELRDDKSSKYTLICPNCGYSCKKHKNTGHTYACGLCIKSEGVRHTMTMRQNY